MATTHDPKDNAALDCQSNKACTRKLQRVYAQRLEQSSQAATAQRWCIATQTERTGLQDIEIGEAKTFAGVMSTATGTNHLQVQVLST